MKVEKWNFQDWILKDLFSDLSASRPHQVFFQRLPVHQSWLGCYVADLVSPARPPSHWLTEQQCISQWVSLMDCADWQVSQ